MAYIRSRQFCCCLPIALGVFSLTLLILAGASQLAASGFIQTGQLNGDKSWLWVYSGMYTILAMVAFLGLMACIVKNRGCVAVYARMLLGHLIFSIVAGIFSMYMLYHRNDQDLLDYCLNQMTTTVSDGATQQACNTGIATAKDVVLALFAVGWVLEFYAYVIVSNYVEQLEDEERAAYRNGGDLFFVNNNYPFTAAGKV